MASRRCLLLALAVHFVATVASVGAMEGHLQLLLDDALVRRRAEQDKPERADLELSLLCVQGTIDEHVQGSAARYSRGATRYTLSDVEVRDTRVSFTLRFAIADDPWIAGGTGEFQVRLEVAGDETMGSFEGAFQQTGFPTEKVKGGVGGLRVPFWPELSKTARYASAEHPRLLFGKADIPALRERAKTPQGRRLIEDLARRVERIRRGAGWGAEKGDNPGATPYCEGYYATGEAFLYILTGDRKHFERAKELMFIAIGTKDGEAGGWGNAPRGTGAALTYDMLYNDLDEATRNEMRRFLMQPTLVEPSRSHNAQTYGAMMLATTGVCHLAALGDPFPEPQPPARVADLPLVAAPKDFTPGEGVTVWPYQSGKMPAELLFLGAFADDGSDPLASVGGCGGIQPKAGMTIAHAGRSQTATPMKAHGISYGHNYRRHPTSGLDMRTWVAKVRDIALDSTARQAAWLHAVVRFDEPTAVVCRPNFNADVVFGTRMWLAGKEVAQDEAVRVEKGLYPVTMKVPLRGTWSAPHLATYDHHAAQREWASLHKRWLLDGKTYPGLSLRLMQARDQLRTTLLENMGERGAMNEKLGITDMRSELLVMLAAYRRMLGNDPFPGAGVEWTVPLNMHAAYGYWGCDWGGGFWPAFAFPATLPAAYRPALRRYLDARLSEKSLEGLVTQPNHNVGIFLSYPWEMDEGGAGDSKGSELPLTFSDMRKGLHTFRGGWDDERSVTVSAFGLTGSHPTSTLATSLRIHGLGAGELVGGMPLGAGFFMDPKASDITMRVTIDGVEPDGGAKTILHEAKPDGSGAVTFDVSTWLPARDDKGKRLDSAPVAGLTLRRSMAVDFSGRSGANALVAVVDKVDGGGDRAVTWNLPVVGRRAQTHAEGPVCTITAANGAKLALRLVHPAEAKWKVSNNHVAITGAREYFVVLTYDKAATPPVTVTGSGLGAKCTIRSASVSYDGTRVNVAQ